jgi:formate dehydrogenase maturation protein FdhE
MKINIEVKSKIDDKKIDEVLTKAIEEKCKENGCPLCGSRNIMVYVYEIEKSGSIRGYIHCKDCNKKSNLTGDQGVHKQVKKITEDFEKSIKRIFR